MLTLRNIYKFEPNILKLYPYDQNPIIVTQWIKQQLFKYLFFRFYYA